MSKKASLLIIGLAAMLISLTACAPAPTTSPPRQVSAQSSDIPAQQKPAPQKWVPPQAEYDFPAKGVPFLYYHSIASLPGNVAGVPPAEFAAQMKYLYDAGFSAVSLDQFYAAYEGKEKLPRKPVVITFDDGYPDNYSIAFPILKQYNFTAAFFVVTGYMEPGQGMLTWDQLREMQAYGMTIGSHTVDHLELSKLSLAEQKNEIFQSKAKIESELGTSVDYFCYPNGKFNQTTLSLLRQAGYKLAVTTAPGTAKRGDNPLLLKRVFVNGLNDLADFKRRVTQAG